MKRLDDLSTPVTVEQHRIMTMLPSNMTVYLCRGNGVLTNSTNNRPMLLVVNEMVHIWRWYDCCGLLINRTSCVTRVRTRHSPVSNYDFAAGLSGAKIMASTCALNPPTWIPGVQFTRSTNTKPLRTSMLVALPSITFITSARMISRNGYLKSHDFSG